MGWGGRFCSPEGRKGGCLRTGSPSDHRLLCATVKSQAYFGSPSVTHQPRDFGQGNVPLCVLGLSSEKQDQQTRPVQSLVRSGLHGTSTMGSVCFQGAEGHSSFLSLPSPPIPRPSSSPPLGLSHPLPLPGLLLSSNIWKHP